MTTRRSDPPVRSVIAFFVLTFAIAWGLVGLYLAVPGPIEAAFGPLRAAHPLFILAVYAPAISAFILVLRYGGTQGLGRFLSRLLLWRCHPGWYVLLIVGLPATFFLGAAIGGTLTREAMTQPPFGELLGLVAFMLVLGPLEEFGWRGYALPLLQRLMAPVWSGLVLGVIWGVWHLPAFLLGGTPQSGWSFLPFLIGATAVSVILTGFFNAARGSILVAILFHWQLNMPMWPDAQPWDNYLFAVLALIVVWVNRAAMFSRNGAATQVIPSNMGPGRPQ
jgi:uncharacterized protein